MRRVTAAIRGVHLAFSWLTVVPVSHPALPIDRDDGRRAIAAAPAVGLLVGAVIAGIGAAISLMALPELLAGVIVVALLAVGSRGMHIDGLADTADGLGCYGDRDKVHAIMHGGSAGPFAIVTLVIVITIQAVGFGTLISEKHWYTLFFVIFLSRFAVTVGCRWRLTPMPGTRFGQLVIGTQRWSIAWWLIPVTLASIAANSDQWWYGPTVVLAVTGITWALSAHCATRFGGLNGDVLGAIAEITCAAALIGFLMYNRW